MNNAQKEVAIQTLRNQEYILFALEILMAYFLRHKVSKDVAEVEGRLILLQGQTKGVLSWLDPQPPG